jgi:hypothetical protein
VRKLHGDCPHCLTGLGQARLEVSLSYERLPIYICIEVTFISPVFSCLTPRTYPGGQDLGPLAPVGGLVTGPEISSCSWGLFQYSLAKCPSFPWEKHAPFFLFPGQNTSFKAVAKVYPGCDSAIHLHKF